MLAKVYPHNKQRGKLANKQAGRQKRRKIGIEYEIG